MAVDSWSGNSSPRISFSYDLHNNEDVIPLKSTQRGLLHYPDHGLDYPDFNFNFCTSEIATTKSSSADELFSNGVILTSNSLPPLPISSPIPSVSKIPKTESGEIGDKCKTTSFWGMKRSSSVHYDSKKSSSFWSLPLLKRSNSTGSGMCKDPKQQKRSLLKEQKSINSSTVTNSFYTYSMPQRPPLKKNYGKVSPVINVGTANLFGFGSFFGNGKDKKIRK